MSNSVSELNRGATHALSICPDLRLKRGAVRQSFLDLVRRLDEDPERSQGQSEEHGPEVQVQTETIGFQEAVDRVLGNWRPQPLPKLQRMENGTVCVRS